MNLHRIIVIILSLLIAVFSSTLSVCNSIRVSNYNEQAHYTYYGFVPSRIYCFNPNRPEDELGVLTRRPPINESEILYVRKHGDLLVTGNYDGTRCWLYRLPEKQLMEEFSVNRFELKAIPIPNGTFFKLVSDKFVTVVLKGGAFLNRVIADTYNADVSTYYPSVKGSYVGKEFIFPATLGEFTFTPYRIFSLEDSEIKIYRSDGSLFKEFNAPANTVVKFSPANGTVYHVNSTGYIMVSTFSFAESCFIPSVEGGFVGRIFYGSGEKRLGGRGEWAFRSYTFLSSLEECKIRVFDLSARRWVKEFIAPSKSTITMQTNDLAEITFETACYVLVAENPVTILYLSNSTVEGGLSIAGLKAGEKAVIYVPEGESFIFAAEDCVLIIDGLSFSLSTDDVLRLEPGIHEVESTGKIIIQVVDLTEHRGLLGFAEALPAAEAIGLTPSDFRVKLPEEGVSGLNLNYMIIAVAAVLGVLAVLTLLFIRRRIRL